MYFIFGIAFFIGLAIIYSAYLSNASEKRQKTQERQALQQQKQRIAEEQRQKQRIEQQKRAAEFQQEQQQKERQQQLADVQRRAQYNEEVEQERLAKLNWVYQPDKQKPEDKERIKRYRAPKRRERQKLYKEYDFTTNIRIAGVCGPINREAAVDGASRPSKKVPSRIFNLTCYICGAEVKSKHEFCENCINAFSIEFYRYATYLLKVEGKKVVKRAFLEEKQWVKISKKKAEIEKQRMKSQKEWDEMTHLPFPYPQLHYEDTKDWSDTK